MTDQEIIIAIAKVRGWKWDEKTIFDPSGKLTQNRYAYDPNGEVWYDRLFGVLPKYPNDLNAMHKAELSHIVPMTTPCYYDTLQFIIFRDKGMDDVGPGFSAWLTHATAAQRAEAFLRTLNLWKP